MRCSISLMVGVLSLSLGGCHCGGGGLNGVTSEGTLNPTTLDFGTLPIGQSLTKTLTLQNIGGAELSLLSVTLGGAFPGDYQVVTSPEGTVLQ
ncbi:MAG TPA: hypothetical protein VH208_04475, partial [Myxococcaceae bacterium]|nr:hypothetical protein [Myxococcaceae bacterium]